MPSPEIINLLSVVVIFALLLMGFKSSFYGLLSYTLVMLFRPGLIYPQLGSIRIELIIGLIVLLMALAQGPDFFNKLSPNYDKINKYMLLFFLVILASFSQAWDYTWSWHRVVIEFVKVYAYFIMIVTLVRSERELRIFFWWLCISTVLVGYPGVFYWIQGKATYIFHGVRVSIGGKGFTEGHVQAANVQLQILPIIYGLLLSQRKNISKIILGCLGTISILAIIASGSRGGFIGLVILGGLCIYFSERKTTGFALAGLLFIVIFLFSNQSYISWMETIIQHQDLSSQSRISGLINGAEMMIRRPLLGVGPGCYPLARRAWFGWGLWSHNHYGQLMGDLGVTGVLIWSVFIRQVFINLKVAKMASKKSGNEGLSQLLGGVQMAIAIRLIEGMFSHSLYIFFWYAMAATSVVAVKNTKSEPLFTSCKRMI